jgi:hypothetical protein
VLVLSAAAIVAFAVWVLYGLGGWTYYNTALDMRSGSAGYRLLRPSGLAGHLFGIGGFALMLVPVAYAMRKNMPRFRHVGSMKTWLEVHIFSGIFGPVLVTFHTSFKFNGIISVAYWSMVIVVLSGFVGRYLWVRIPRSLRGIELTHADLDARATALAEELESADLPDELLAKVAAFEERLIPAEGSRRPVLGLLVGEWTTRRALAALRREIEAEGAGSDILQNAARAVAERATLIRQAVYLEKTKRLFDLWHVFHMPLVYVMFAIVALHVVVTVYMGYVPFVY